MASTAIPTTASGKTSQGQRQVVLVDQHDRVVGQTDVLHAHRGDGILHRAITVFIFRNLTGHRAETEVLLQQRSQYKIVGARKWATTACGNVRPGENRKQCALRRLDNEMGIVGVSLTPVDRFTYHVQTDPGFSEWEVLTAYAGWGDVSVAVHPEEVSDFVWYNWQQLQQDLAGVSSTNLSSKWAMWLTYFMHRPSLARALDTYVEGRVEMRFESKSTK